MTNILDKEIDILHKEVIKMGNLCEKAIEHAAKALLNNDCECARQAIQIEQEIDDKEKDIEKLCLQILLKQHPVAKDLRKISATLKMLTDLERIGDQASDIAQIVLDNDLSMYKNSSHIQEISAATVKMVSTIIDAYVQNDLNLCEYVISYDTVVDKLFSDMKNDVILIVKNNVAQVENAMFLLMIAKYFERIGDHAENIAYWVGFSITGRHNVNE